MPGDTPDRVETIVVEHLGVADRFAWDADLRGDLGADSLDLVELAMACEDEFGVRIPDAAADRWRTADDMRRTVEEGRHDQHKA